MGKPSTKAQNKYIAKAYDRIIVIVPKGDKDTIRAAATAQGKSLNSYITEAIRKFMSDNNHAQ